MARRRRWRRRRRRMPMAQWPFFSQSLPTPYGYS